MKSKLTVDILLFLFMILEFSRMMIRSIYHEIFGIILIILTIIHLYLNRNYIKNILKGKYNKQRVIMLIINLSFIISFILSILFGILSSEDILKFLNIKNLWVIKFHKITSYISLVLMGTHLGINLDSIINKINKKKNKILLSIIGIAIILYGIYSFQKLNILNHITGYYEFSFSENSIPLNMIQYMSISIGISIITHNIYKLTKNKKSIVIYFSRADENYSVGMIDKGNTEVIAEYISEITNADMFKVEPKIPYSKDYNTCTLEAKERQEKQDAPIIQELPDLREYEIIYIGSPVYWEYLPEELVTALKTKDFSGKTIRPFTTHEGSGLGNIPSQIQIICTGGRILEGLAIQGSSVNNSKKRVEDWI